MSDNRQRLEAEGLWLLLDGDDPVLKIVCEQLDYLVSTSRGYTDVGVFVNYRLPEDAPQLPGGPSFAFGDLFVKAEGLE